MMLEKLRQKLIKFITSDKDTPLLAGFSIGFYMLLFYYSKNFSLANSLQQFIFFVCYYILLPMLVLWVGYKIAGLYRKGLYKKHFLFIAIIVVFAFNVFQITGFSRLRFGLVGIAAMALSFPFRKYYKLFIVLLFFMSVFNIGPLVKVIQVKCTVTNVWMAQPDAIENIVFRQRPNIYYIQPDGYTNEENLKSKSHDFNNTRFIKYLQSSGFKVYTDFRSNYFSTLTSNSSMFSMKHHFLQDDIDLYAARDIIMSNNAVLRTLKHNKYKTIFISEKPYLVMNRPQSAYDYMNIKYSEIPYLKDGWSINKDVLSDLKLQIAQNSKEGNFYFIEKLTPNHIQIYNAAESNAEAEKKKYLSALHQTNQWLKETLDYIQQNDPGALVIIAADHGGFVGFSHTYASLEKTSDTELIKGIFGAHLSVKWNKKNFEQYDKGLKSSVNLFRTIFAYLAEDDKFLEHLQENSSYIKLEKPSGIYRYIDDKGNIVFEKADAVQD